MGYVLPVRERGRKPRVSEEATTSTGSAPPSRIVVADDHPLFRGALKWIVSVQPDLEVVGEAADGREALELCRRLRPDLVLMDLQMPKMNGIEATRAIKEECSQTIVLMLTALEDPDHLSEAIEAGASGYVLKHAENSQIIDAIRRVLREEHPLNQELAMRLLRRMLDDASEKNPTYPASLEGQSTLPPAHGLTPREVEVLKLLARGQTNRQIAQSLLISDSTVKKHVRQLLTKLEVSDRTQAAVRAIQLGLRPDRDV